MGLRHRKNAVTDDHTEIFGSPERGGLTRTARALAIVHAAVYDAVHSIDRSYTPYLILVRLRPHTDVSIAAAVAAAAYGTLMALMGSDRHAGSLRNCPVISPHLQAHDFFVNVYS
jgi:hypothetical protein